MKNTFIYAALIMLFSSACLSASTSAISSQINVDLTNSYSPTVEPTYENTGKITWLSEQSVVKNDPDDILSFLVDYDPTGFQYLMLDTNLLTENTDFELQSEPDGAVISIFNSALSDKSSEPNEILDETTEGQHLVTVVFDGQSYSSNFTLVTILENQPDDQGDNTDTTPVPDTGQNTNNNTSFSETPFLPIILIIALLAGIFYGIKIFRKNSASNFNKTTRLLVQRNPWTNSQNFTINHMKKNSVIILSIIVLGVIGTIVATVSHDDEDTSAIDANDELLTLTLSSDDIDMSVNVVDDAVSTTASQTVSVTDATDYGYQLYLSMDDSMTNNSLYPNNDPLSNNKISAVTGNQLNPAELVNNTWGYTMDEDATSVNKWLTVPMSNSKVLIKYTNSATPANDTTTVYYGAKLSRTLSTNIYSGKISYIAIANSKPDTTYYLHFNANGGSNEPDDLEYTSAEESHIFTISNTIPVRDNYTFLGWSTSSTATTAEYSVGDQITLSSTSPSEVLYAVWSKDDPTPEPEPTPVTTYSYTLAFSANGGNGAPSNLNYTGTETAYTFTVPISQPTRNGYDFLGWSTSSSASSSTYNTGSSIELDSSSPTLTLYAVWKVTSTNISVSSISISGDDDISMNASSPTSQLGATVSPSNASNKKLSWSSSDDNIATVNNNGLVTGVDSGTVNITATATDGSGISTTYTININKKVIIIIGASQVYRFTNHYYNITSYTNSTTNHLFKTDGEAWSGAGYSNGNTKGTLNYVAETGTSFAYQTGEGWKKALNLINKYSDRKSLTSFEIYFPMAGNGIKEFTCSEISTSNSTIKGYAKAYNTAINNLVDSGYTVKGHVVSVQPVVPSEASSKTVVANSDTTNRCEKDYRSNYKYHEFNVAMHDIINDNIGATYTNLKYVSLFKDIMDVSDSSHYTFKSGWTDYATVDGIHWNETTANKYLNAMLNKNTSL